jgi:hypothetical protein
VQTTKTLCHFLTLLKIAPPWKVYISIVGINGFSLVSDNLDESPRAYDGDVLHLPPVLVKSAAATSDMQKTATLLRSQLDYMTRGFGLAYNFCFTESGVWNLR